MKRLFAFLALCIPIYLFAQGFGSFTHDQPYFAIDRVSGGPEAALPAGIGYRWVADDLTNSPVSAWIDRIQGVQLVQTNASYRPTWNPNGVRFSSAAGHFLETNGAVAMTWNFGAGVDGSLAKDSLLVVCKFTSLSTQTILDDVATKMVGIESPSSWYFPNFGLVDGAGANVLYGYFYSGYSGGIGGDYITYTNGVTLLSSINGSIGTSNPRYVGFRAGPQNFDGIIKEIIVWTNVVGINAIGASNVNFYVTNRYTETNVLGTWNPTTNASLLSAYDVGTISATNGQIITSIPDLGPKGFHLRTTNSPLYIKSGLTNGGLPHIGFNVLGGANQMAGTNFSTIYAQPITVIMVMNSTATVEGGFDFLFDNCNVPLVYTNEQNFYKDANANMTAGSTQFNSDRDYSQFYAYEWYFNGASSNIRTNNVQRFSANVGSNGKSGIALAGARGWEGTYTSPMDFYWAAIYTNTLSATERSNVYYYLGVRFDIPGLQ